MVRSFIPTHKKGSALSYENIRQRAPHCLAFYHSPYVQKLISSLAGRTVYVTPECDQSSLSILCYREPGDHINWHYDHNFYRGRHFTVLLSLRNSSAAEGLPTAVWSIAIAWVTWSLTHRRTCWSCLEDEGPASPPHTNRAIVACC